MTTASFEKARKNLDVFMTGGVALTFPAFGDQPEKKLFIGTREFEGDDGELYRPGLSDMPNLRSQRGLGQDGVDFSLNDPNSLWYDEIKPYEEVFVDTECVAREFLKTENGIFESEIISNGFLEQMSLSESNLQIQFSAISDMSRTGFLVGGRILTQRYCAAKFNRNGLKNPLFDACGWTTAQGGNPLFCTHKLKGVDGCEDHMNDWRLFAVEALSSAEITGTTNGGGFTYGGGPCFPPKTLIWMADGSYKPIRQVKKGERVMSFDIAGNLVKRKVLETFEHTVSSHIVFDFGKDRQLGVTPEHPLLIAPDRFLPAGGFDAGDTVRAQSENGWLDFAIRNNWLKEIRTRVHNLRIWGSHTYFVVVAGVKIGVHNSKAEGI